PTQFITDITTPIQIQVGSADDTVPPNFSSSLSGKLKSSSKNVDYIEYPGADHNLTPSLSQVMSQAISFFDKYLK
ncbi:MAG: prolyl oligopeptidase family serine peptidase, partial [Patescibacteria group bacterium]|nr:prolyl oligopeptidase family serine peptidase [Patescibacteria group bacterium]